MENANILLNAINGEDFDLDPLKNLDNIDIITLREELKSLPVYLKMYNDESKIMIKKVTMVSTILDIFN